MSAILMAPSAIYHAIGGALTKTGNAIYDFALWLVGRSPTRVYSSLAERISTDLEGMKLILEERKTSWISLTCLFGEHKTATSDIAKTLGIIEKRIGDIYSGSKKRDQISQEESQNLKEIREALHGRMGTLIEMKESLPSQYTKIEPTLLKIARETRAMLITADEAMTLTADPKAASKEVAETFTTLSKEVERIYEAHQGKPHLSLQARERMSEIRRETIGCFGIIKALKAHYPDYYQAIEGELKLMSPLVFGIGILPSYTINDLKTVPSYARESLVKERLGDIRFALSEEMIELNSIINRNRALVSIDDFYIEETVEVSAEAKNMVPEARRLIMYYKHLIEGSIYIEGSGISEMIEDDRQDYRSLDHSLPFFERLLKQEKAAQAEQRALNDMHQGIFEKASDYAGQAVQGASSLLSGAVYSTASMLLNIQNENLEANSMESPEILSEGLTLSH